MKKFKLSTLAVIGIQIGILCTGCQNLNSKEKMPPEMQTFYEQLQPDAQKKFLQLDTKHREYAMNIVEQACKSDNACKGHREQAVEQQYQLQMQGK